MASNVLSKLLPSNNMAPSIYEDLRAHDEASEPSDVEERAGLGLDEENLSDGFHDYDLDRADVFDGEASRVTTENTAFLPHQHGRGLPTHIRNEVRNTKDNSKPDWIAQSPRILEDDGDDDVPASLLIEGDDIAGPSEPPQQQRQSTRPQRAAKPRSVPGPTTNDTRSRWDAAQAHQQLHEEDDVGRLPPKVPKRALLTGSPRDKALWTWLNATNLDHFMGEVYDYYTGAGIWCICLQRFLSLL
jgi:autophagy-related protein 9